MTLYARPTFPGIGRIISCSVTIGHGVAPTGFRLAIGPQPQGDIYEEGIFGLEFNNERIEFPGCRIDRASFVFDTAGNMKELTILDRRWKWALAYYDGNQVYGRISGEYNARREDGTIRKLENPHPPANPNWAIDDSERTPQQLAELLLKAAGEPFDAQNIAALPNDTRPYMLWDSANPMAELNRLCELLNCRVVLDHRDNQVKIVRLNDGALLPDGKVIRLGGGANFRDNPDQVDLLPDNLRIQHDFLLEATGTDIDGAEKLIDDLSYKPTDGWKDLDLYSNGGEFDDAATRNLANRSVYRHYRIKVPFNLPGPNGPIEITRREQIVLLGQQVFKETVDGVKTPRDALVYGVWYLGDDAQAENSREKLVYLPDESVDADPEHDEKALQIVTVGFRIDPERRMVVFSQPVWAEDETSENAGDFLPATLRLRTTCFVLDPVTGMPAKNRYSRKLTNATRPYSLPLVHDEIRPTLYAKYNEQFEPVEVINNAAEIDFEIEHYLDQAVAFYSRAKLPQTVEYGGWRFNLPLDGAIQSITWTLDGSGPRTTVDRCHDSGVSSGMPYKTLASYQRLADAERKTSRLDWMMQQLRLLGRATKEN